MYGGHAIELHSVCGAKYVYALRLRPRPDTVTLTERHTERHTERQLSRALGTATVVYQGTTIDFDRPWRRATMADMVKEGIGQFLEEEEKTGAGAGGGGGGGALDTLLRRRWLSGFCFDRLRSTVEAGHATGATALAEGRRVAEAVGVSTKEIEAMGSAGEALYACF